MDQQAFEAARAAYQNGDWAAVVSAASVVRQPGEVCGASDHLKGNALMKLGRYSDAAEAYADALLDTAYGKRGALSCNQGRALLAAGRPADAVAPLVAATADADYATPYKAQMALGTAKTMLGDLREAGIAYRNAAIDESNPEPAKALLKLGDCFMGLGRPVDAIEALRTALDFSTPLANQSQIYASLGSAYVAANRMNEAIDAFGKAIADGSFQLTAEQQASYNAAQKAVAAISARQPSETDAMLAAAGFGDGATGTGSFDPLDPLGKSGELMPSPEDTGFFSVTESDLMQAEADDRKMRRKHKHTGLKVFFFILFLLVVIGGAVGFAYYKGYGWPTQESVTEELFSSVSNNGDASSVLADSVSDTAAKEIVASNPTGSTVKVDGVNRGMSKSTVFATATLSAGGTANYTIDMVRVGFGWKVSGLTVEYPSQVDNGTTTSTGTLSATTDEPATTQQAATTDEVAATTDEAATTASADGAAADQATE